MKTTILFFLIFICASSSFAKDTFLGFNVGSTTIYKPGLYTDDVADGGYGLHSGFTFGVKAKRYVPKINADIVALFNYTKFTNTDKGNDLKQNMYIMGLRLQRSVFTIADRANINFGFDVFYNYFDKLKVDSETYEESEKISSIGIGFGATVEVPVNEKTIIELGAQYNACNFVRSKSMDIGIDTVLFSAGILLGIH